MSLSKIASEMDKAGIEEVISVKTESPASEEQIGKESNSKRVLQMSSERNKMELEAGPEEAVKTDKQPSSQPPPLESVNGFKMMTLETGEQVYLCSFCPNKYITKDFAVKHMKKVHGEKTKSSSYNTRSQKRSNLDEQPQKVDTKTCEVKLKRCDENSQEETTPADDNENAGEEVETSQVKPKLEGTRRQKNRKLHLCTYPGCGKQFRSAGNLRNHTQTHPGENPFECKVCFKRCTQAGALVLHMRVHSKDKAAKVKLSSKGRMPSTSPTKSDEDKVFECDVCSQRFGSANILANHVRIHTGEKPYKCNVCSKRFTQVSGLIGHKRIHTGERPFKCPYCDQSCRISSNLYLHIRTIHGKEQEEAYRRTRKLQKTGTGPTPKINRVRRPILPKKPKVKTTVEPPSLKSKKKARVSLPPKKAGPVKNGKNKSNSNIPCDICGELFANPWNVARHMKRKHKKDKRPSVGLRRGRSSQSSSTQKKIKEKSPVPVYACMMCSKPYKVMDVLESHMIEAHGLYLSSEFDKSSLLCKP